MHRLSGHADGQTPLDPDEAAGLRSSAIATRAELDAAEQANIAQATRWAFARRRGWEQLLDEPFVRRLHQRMFGDVWRWAGTYRTTARNLGVEAWQIREALAVLLSDARYWVDHETYAADELCVRFHHRLVSIHPFPNGNGRHARLMADLLARARGRQPFTWGRRLDLEPSDLRERYIAALRAADAGDVSSLISFARA